MTRRPRSLAVRLTFWYGLSSFLLIALVTAFLYWALLANFEQQNERYLDEKIAILRTLLQRSGDEGATVKWEVEEEIAAHPSIRVLSRVLSSGQPLFETPGMTEELPLELFAANPGSEVRSRTGHVYRVLRTAVEDASHRQFHIQAALDLGFQQDLLTRYRNQLWGALAAGLALSLLIGYRVTNRGILPIRQIAAAVQRIRSNTLDERINLQNSPSEIQALSEAFNQTLDRLQDAFARLSQFSSDIAHELRTPVNNLRGELEVALSRTRSNSEYKDVIGSALEESLRISRLIESLLFLARAEQPEAGVHRERLNLSEELRKLADYYEVAALDQQVAMRTDISADLYANLDRNLLQRAVGNVLENALRYTPPFGQIMLKAESIEGQLAISVSDTGPGIPAAHVGRLRPVLSGRRGSRGGQRRRGTGSRHSQEHCDVTRRHCRSGHGPRPGYVCHAALLNDENVILASCWVQRRVATLNIGSPAATNSAVPCFSNRLRALRSACAEPTASGTAIS